MAGFGKQTMESCSSSGSSPMQLPLISVEETPSPSTLVLTDENDRAPKRKNGKSPTKQVNSLDSECSVKEEDVSGSFTKSLSGSSASSVTAMKRRIFSRSSNASWPWPKEEPEPGLELQPDGVKAAELEEKLKCLATAFSARMKRTMTKIQQPPTPSSSESESEPSAEESDLRNRLQVYFPKSPDPSYFGGDEDRRHSFSEKVNVTFSHFLKRTTDALSCNYILDPQSTVYISWLTIVSVVILYNCWVIPLRIVFPYQTAENVHLWMYFDYVADAFYVIDMVAFKSHIKFIQNGLWVKEPRNASKSYFNKPQFTMDLLSIFPVDILVTCVYKNIPWLRLPRMLKVETFWELFRRYDTVLASPHSARIVKTIIYMMFMIHLNACAYYALSAYIGIATTTWTFNGQGNAYVRCFYFATKTATSIGKNPKPQILLEHCFMIVAWLGGVFIFALLIGQIRDIIATATKVQSEYRQISIKIISYLHRFEVPKHLQDKVKLWLSYTFQQQKTLDERRILDLLPQRMKMDIALNIHVETIAKVKLFQNCEVAFLRDLVVKLRSIIFLPGDYVCRKGEIGKTMYIIKSGRVDVLGGPSGSQILATLGEGSVFGEIALLGIGGMSKRTADVRSAGYSNLFELSKDDLNEATRDYPQVQELMRKKAQKMIRENAKKAKAIKTPVSDDEISDLSTSSDVIIRNRQQAPKLIGALMQLFPPTSMVSRYIKEGSKASSPTTSEKVEPEVKAEKPASEAEENSTGDECLSSYPPSPFVPGTPGHLSQQMNISLMSGDSSDAMLLPPGVQGPDNININDGGRSSRMSSENDATENDAKSIDYSVASFPVGRDTPTKPFFFDSDSSYSPISPPPALTFETVTANQRLTDSQALETNIPQTEARYCHGRLRQESWEDRELLPVEVRPPVYAIQSRHHDHEDEEHHDTISSPSMISSPSLSLTSRIALGTSKFVQRLRSPIRRQVKIDAPDDAETLPSSSQHQQQSETAEKATES